MRSLTKDKLEDRLASNLASNFNKPYEEIRKVIKDNIHKSSMIIDIGCNDGKIEDYIDELGFPNTVYCLDINGESLKKLNQRKFKNTIIRTIHQDANKFLQSAEPGQFDVVIINNTLHETNTPDNQAVYLDTFFERLKHTTKTNGTVILADHYYAKNLSDKEVTAYIREQYKRIKHASTRKEFILPEL